jgi:hypothetical protein
MWQEISDRIKSVIGEDDYNTYCGLVHELGYCDNILRLQCPNRFYANKVSDCIKKSGYLIGKVEWLFAPTPVSVGTSQAGSVPAETKAINKNKINPKRKRTSFERTPKFKSASELNIYIDETKSDVQQLNTPQLSGPAKTSQITVMPNKYGLTGVANWITLNSAMWTYPNDKRKSATVPIYIDCTDGSKVCYTLYRGKITPKDDGYGQLTTTHCRSMMAIISLWQQQGCKLSGSCAIVECIIADIIHLLGIKYNGAAYKRVLQYITDLAALPICMGNESSIALSYSLLYSVGSEANGKYKLLIHPFITRQLVGRKAVIRDSSILNIRTPIALKLLLLLDSRLAVGHKVVISLVDLVKELDITDIKTSSLVNNVKRAMITFKEVSVCGKTIDMQLSKDSGGKWQLTASLKPFALVKNEIKDLVGCKF